MYCLLVEPTKSFNSILTILLVLDINGSEMISICSSVGLILFDKSTLILELDLETVFEIDKYSSDNVLSIKRVRTQTQGREV